MNMNANIVISGSRNVLEEFWSGKSCLRTATHLVAPDFAGHGIETLRRWRLKTMKTWLMSAVNRRWILRLARSPLDVRLGDEHVIIFKMIKKISELKK